MSCLKPVLAAGENLDPAASQSAPPPVPDDADSAPESITPGRIACDNCGKALPSFARFCGHCGHRLQP